MNPNGGQIKFFARGAKTIDHGDLILLTSWMVTEGYSADNIAEAVRKPWHWADVLAEAKADLTGRA